MRRTLIVSAVGATTMLIGLGVGAALATTDSVRYSPIATHMTMAGCPMMEMSDMTDMSDMNGMMQMMMGSSMMGEQTPEAGSVHEGHHQEVRP